MKQFTIWQVICSYLCDIVLEKTSTKHNPYLEVALSRGRLRLNSTHVTYSYADLYHNFYSLFKHLNIQKQPLNQVLILGFGLGSIAYMLNRKFAQVNAQYIGIEIDEVIVQLAQKYLPQDLREKTTLYCQDAATWVADYNPSMAKYDLIAVDLFIDLVIPPYFLEAPFLQSLKQLLTTNGLLVFNCLASNNEQVTEALSFFETTFKPNFSNSETFKTPANLMLIAYP